MSTTIATTTTFPVGTWYVDPTHSHVGFELDYMGGVFHGSFSPVEARFEADAQGNVKLKGSARADAVKVQDENLSADLLSPQFFDASRTPILGFEASDIARSGDDVSISGGLTIKGVTRLVDLHGTVSESFTDAYGRERFTLKLTGAVDRTDFGLDWNIALPTGEPALSNDVRLVAELYFIKG